MSTAACTDPSCARVVVRLEGFAPNSTYDVHLTSPQGDFTAGGTDYGALTITTDAKGSAAKECTCFYGYPDGWVSAEVDGVTGRLDPWE